MEGRFQCFNRPGMCHTKPGEEGEEEERFQCFSNSGSDEDKRTRETLETRGFYVIRVHVFHRGVYMPCGCMLCRGVSMSYGSMFLWRSFCVIRVHGFIEGFLCRSGAWFCRGVPGIGSFPGGRASLPREGSFRRPPLADFCIGARSLAGITLCCHMGRAWLGLAAAGGLLALGRATVGYSRSGFSHEQDIHRLYTQNRGSWFCGGRLLEGSQIFSHSVYYS